ncbi:MAG: cellulase family glycosylhydrolase [Gemmataceae bacterium]
MRRPPYFAASVFAATISFVQLSQRVVAEDGKSATRLGTDSTRFTINDKPAFLLGVSYYGGLGASEETLRKDLAELKKNGFNWIRVWATWSAFGEDVSVVDGDGKPREDFLKRLQRLVAACDEHSLVVDVTLSRGRGLDSPSRLQTLDAHRRAVEALVAALKSHGNWYFDLANERNVKDKRFTSFADLKDLRELVRELDPHRLVTASHGGDISQADLKDYLMTVKVDFLSPHRPRDTDSPSQTETKTKEYLALMKNSGVRYRSIIRSHSVGTTEVGNRKHRIMSPTSRVR